MIENIMIVANAEQFAGEYVTTDGANSCKVVSHNIEPNIAYDDAVSSGVENPVLIYMPNSNESHFIF